MEEIRNGASSYSYLAFQTSNVESIVGHESLAKKEGARLDSQFRVRCHTKGKRLGDVDGRSIKAVFDALTKAGIWPDDSALFLKEVSFSQEKSDVEETVIEIYKD